MSAEALRAVMKHSTTRGPELLVQLAIAHLSDSRHGYYPKTTAAQPEIAKAARLSLPRTKAIIASLIKHGRLFLVSKGTGHEPNIYELPIRGTFREVSESIPQEVLKSIPLIREAPNTQTVCATPAPAQKIILYPKPQRKRKKA